MGTELAATFAAARNQHFNAAAAAAAATAPATVTRASTCPSSLPPTSTSIISPVANVVASSSGFAPKDSFVNTLVENYNTTVKKNQNLSDNSILSRHIKKDSILNDSSGGATSIIF
ncbi:uncharacterized protein SAPINGB_P003320 [Magnusiomyces paraingens]|uniref:Uncharacterized protein n=1 Tax=Magnusiomyces paraingens TaxID=2606893 RepID=A0A5E8BNP9_9ASCO|nr:uncharacterized protein SAPINGB_P003320 [Saprochaete ingens]VVT52933.1 unnamed protein product [Saprochaete ingens]